MQSKMRFQPVPDRSPVLGRRLHHHFFHPFMLQPCSQMPDLTLGRAKLPLDIRHLPTFLATNHHGQHLFVNINSSYTPSEHSSSPLRPGRQRTGSVNSHPHGLTHLLRRVPLVYACHGPRSNTNTASPYPVSITTLTAAPGTHTFSYLSMRPGAFQHECRGGTLGSVRHKGHTTVRSSSRGGRRRRRGWYR